RLSASPDNWLPVCRPPPRLPDGAQSSRSANSHGDWRRVTYRRAPRSTDSIRSGPRFRRLSVTKERATQPGQGSGLGGVLRGGYPLYWLPEEAGASSGDLSPPQLAQ